MSLQDDVSRNVRMLAAARGLSVAGVARLMGVRSQALSNKLTGRVRWNTDDLAGIARVLDVEPEQLVSTAWWPASVTHDGRPLTRPYPPIFPRATQGYRAKAAA